MDIEADVTIIGGGIVGVSVAYFLSRGTRRVVLLERGELASEASGANPGVIGGVQGWGHTPDLQAHLTMGSLEIFKTLQFELGHDIAFRQSGSLKAIQTELEYEHCRDKFLRARSKGYAVELLTIREARAIEPELAPDLLGCLYMPLRAQADPKATTRAFALEATRAGARVETGAEVNSLAQNSDGTFKIGTPERRYRSHSLILAAGAWCGPLGKMLGLDIPIEPVRGQMWSIEHPPARTFHNFTTAESSLAWARRSMTTRGPGSLSLTHDGAQRITRHLYGRQTREGKIMFGGDRQVVGFHKQPDAEGIMVNRSNVHEVLPFLRGLSIDETWSGLMPFSRDGRPFLGEVSQYRNLFIASGLDSSGFGRGPMAGKLVAEAIERGAPHPLLDTVKPGSRVGWLGESPCGANSPAIGAEHKRS